MQNDAAEDTRARYPGLGSQILIGALVILLGWLIVTSGMARVTANGAPEIALRFRGSDGPAHARLADIQMLSKGGTREAEKHALLALERSPTSGVATRTLGFAAEARGDRGRAARLLTYAADLTRRDLATQLWMIEDEVARNNVAGALVHFDTALRTSPASWNILMPVLTSALDDQRLIEPIAQLLATKPFWGSDYLQGAGRNANATHNLALLHARLEKLGAPPYPHVTQEFVTRLVSLGQFEDAALVYRAKNPGWDRSDQRAQLDAAFTGANRLTPLDWSLNGGNVVAVPPGETSGGSLNFSLQGSGNFELARKLLMLRPGKYVFSAPVDVDSINGDWRLGMDFQCVSANPVIGKGARSIAETGAVHLQRELLVTDAGCPAQLIVFSAQSELSSSAISGDIGKVGLTISRSPGD